MDRSNPQISLRQYNKNLDIGRQSKYITGGNVNVETSICNDIITNTESIRRECTARIIGLAYDYDGTTPLLTPDKYLQYQWIECERVDISGTIEWHDVSQNPRGSIKVSAGEYLNLAHEANGLPMPVAYTMMYAGLLEVKNNSIDYEHIFYAADEGYAIAQSDWNLGTWRTGTISSPGTLDIVSVKRCSDILGDGVQGDAFDVSFITRSGRDPAVFGPYTNAVGDQPGDVIRYKYDWQTGFYFCTSDAYDDPLGTIKYGFFDYTKIRKGWAICDGTLGGGGAKIDSPDTRSLYTRATDIQGGNLWGDNDGGVYDKYIGASDGTGGNAGIASFAHGGRAGISSSQQTYGTDGITADQLVVQQLEDSLNWAGIGSDGSPTAPRQVVVQPPTFVLTQVIRNS